MSKSVNLQCDKINKNLMIIMTYRGGRLRTHLCAVIMQDTQNLHIMKTYNRNMVDGYDSGWWWGEFKISSVSRIVHCLQQQQLLLELYHI
jgi:hypothetical protein